MKYRNVEDGIFLNRPNRFIAEVKIGNRTEKVHVKNTGRCRELLIPGTAVSLEKSSNPLRKTAYDLIAVRKPGLGWVNIDSQVTNSAVAEWLAKRGFDCIKPEYSYGTSRFDFYMEKGTEKYLLEVKGCTLEKNGIGYFPDAPTARGVKHLKELIAAKKEGYNCYLAFVIAMPEVTEVRPNKETDEAFSAAYYEAISAGIEVLMLPCYTSRDEIYIVEN